MNPITTEQATIRTASVEVKTLTLGKKQMTLSVFRQLPREHIMDPDTMTLRGTPWGIVNYFWDGCGYCKSDGEHLHVVWEKGGRLFRACVGTLWQEDSDEVRGDPVALAAIDEDGETSWCSHPDYAGHYTRPWPGFDFQPFCQWWDECYSKLTALDQLFIAV